MLKDLFIGFYRPTNNEFKELWENCHFVFDANMLLNVYRYSDLARETLIKIFYELNDRIWIPHQAALEYHFNILEEIKKQEKTYKELQSFIKKKALEIEEEYKKFSLRHSNLKMDEKLLKNLQDSIENLCEDLNFQQNEHPDLNETKDEIMKIFTNKVGNPYTQEKIDEIQIKGETRYNLKQPPGFKDNKKEGTRYHDDRIYENKYGDLILWNQIMDYSYEKEVPIIFITDDRKDDWWNTIMGEKVGPSPQLLQEFQKNTNGNTFYMYQPKQFLSFINKFLDIKIDKKTIEKAIQNIDDYKKQIEEAPKPGKEFIRYKSNGKRQVIKAHMRQDMYIPEHVREINNNEHIYKYLLVFKLSNKEGENPLSLLLRISSTLKELLPSNEITVEPISIGESAVTTQIIISGSPIGSPKHIEIFLGGRLESLGCKIISFQEWDN
ncbi:PIN-like domain-containing protein [Priestia aryabhattai]|uniref:PIN-like domain-containing protein n=1 Tax=Priestia aryabhattai TaxID=412384 RepID=UPI002E21A401|nr:PIN-like domain-containing protein [Priestia aryabhattai]